jgi:hypothetical protein
LFELVSIDLCQIFSYFTCDFSISFAPSF